MTEDTSMMSCTGICVAKVYLLVFDVVFMLTGVVVLAVGCITVVSVIDLHGAYDEVELFYVPYILIGTGAIVIILGIIGFVAAYKEIPNLLLLFLVCLVLVFGLELVLGILTLVFSDQLEEELTASLKESLRSYKEKPIMDTWDRLHSDLNCCGVEGFTDWGNITDSDFAKGQAPDSCCLYFTEGCGMEKNAQFHTKGCQDTVLDVIEENMFILGAAAIACGVFQLVGMIATLVLFFSLKRKGTYA
ncbi:tetraspanin-9-like [Amphiura filiformis]|uniref:tetraspanin-9-like n=1 Tax=Amphiura filiformis TaxID=82378 RepID=UPI003B20FCBD